MDKGDKYGKLTILSELKTKKGGRVVICKCECGNIKEMMLSNVIKSKACGCENGNPTHRNCFNGKVTSEYSTYASAKNRCHNANSNRYKDYGGRGIKFCWTSFEDFLKDMGKRPEGTSLDRIDNNGNYSKENCRWATKKEQSNNMRNNVWIEYLGRTQTLARWRDELNINSSTLRMRLHRGWSVERAFSKK